MIMKSTLRALRALAQIDRLKSLDIRLLNVNFRYKERKKRIDRLAS